MIELLQISRGGSGGVTGAKILAEAAMYEGLDSQAIPKYGAERRGAKVEAYVRFDTSPIRIHSPVYNPTHAMVLDSSLIKSLEIDKVSKDGIIMINSSHIPDFLKGTNRKVAYVDATSISKELGLVVSGFTLTNVTMLGCFAKATGIIKIENIEKAIEKTLGAKIAPKNIEAARRAYEKTKVEIA
ncbi:MAG: 2-oxoacid:acceptor oxidoreductase family protein [Candidatus Heimdallarchaeaceae archaeon]|uniref:pyruvate synthase n=1 Tax=Candidatus Heimdallarchaeum endolithica TaxID=2876572 RepID=A0A9Y1BRJ6_9ARCH|nr:MAG: 2-oxoacid:acceptor oxidoreductase family protein [Candidatus Heimdallarchaeum endolithica]